MTSLDWQKKEVCGEGVGAEATFFHVPDPRCLGSSRPLHKMRFPFRQIDPYEFNPLSGPAALSASPWKPFPLCFKDFLGLCALCVLCGEIPVLTLAIASC